MNETMVGRVEALEAWSSHVLELAKDRRIPSADLIADGEVILEHVRAEIRRQRLRAAVTPAMARGAGRLGIPVEEYAAHALAGERWCTYHQAWHPKDEFSASTTKPIGAQNHCRVGHREYMRGYMREYARERRGRGR